MNTNPTKIEVTCGHHSYMFYIFINSTLERQHFLNQDYSTLCLGKWICHFISRHMCCNSAFTIVPSFPQGPLLCGLRKWQSQKLLSNHPFFEWETGENHTAVCLITYIHTYTELFIFKVAFSETWNQPGYGHNYIMGVTKQWNYSVQFLHKWSGITFAYVISYWFLQTETQ